MASAGTAGHVALWDLEKKRLLSTMYDCHDGSVSSLHFLPSQPLLVSTGQDNSINVSFSLYEIRCSYLDFYLGVDF